MASRNKVVMQESGGVECIVSRVRQVHQGSPYCTMHATAALSLPTAGVHQVADKPRSAEATRWRSVSRGNFDAVTSCFQSEGIHI